jgi:hypothetical protein
VTLKEGSQISIGGLHDVCMCVSVTRSQPNSTLMGESGAAFSTTINKTPNDGISGGRMVSDPSYRVPETCRIYANAH